MVVPAIKGCQVTKRLAIRSVAQHHPDVAYAGSDLWRADTGTFVLCLDYGPVTHCSSVELRSSFFSNGRSGPHFLDKVYPKSPLEDGSASLMHDLCAHSIGMTKRECDCAYGIVLSHYIRPYLAHVAKTTLDILPNWFTRMDDTWAYNEPSMSVHSKWCF